jgi:hypothetical protein
MAVEVEIPVIVDYDLEGPDPEVGIYTTGVVINSVTDTTGVDRTIDQLEEENLAESILQELNDKPSDEYHGMPSFRVEEF